MELWDAYNKNYEKLDGVTLVRGETIPEGVFHLVCDVIVRHRDGTYLLMQRDRRKHFGGMWEVTAGGSALQGETPMECAMRELREETGIEAEVLTELGRVVRPENRTIYTEFLCVTDREKDAIVLQDGETSAYRWVTGEQLCSMTREELVTERMQRFIGELQTGRGDAVAVMGGEPDAEKLKSSMTLFAEAAGEPGVFHEVPERFFCGEQDRRMLKMPVIDGKER